MREAELQSAILELATLYKWRVHHDRPSKNASGQWSTAISGDPGFPDLCMARTGRVIFAELKVKGRKLSDHQTDWFGELQGGRVEVYLWTELDWHDGTIEAILKRLS